MLEKRIEPVWYLLAGFGAGGLVGIAVMRIGAKLFGCT